MSGFHAGGDQPVMHTISMHHRHEFRVVLQLRCGCSKDAFYVHVSKYDSVSVF